MLLPTHSLLVHLKFLLKHFTFTSADLEHKPGEKRLSIKNHLWGWCGSPIHTWPRTQAYQQPVCYTPQPQITPSQAPVYTCTSKGTTGRKQTGEKTQMKTTHLAGLSLDCKQTFGTSQIRLWALFRCLNTVSTSNSEIYPKRMQAWQTWQDPGKTHAHLEARHGTISNGTTKLKRHIVGVPFVKISWKILPEVVMLASRVEELF